MLEMNKMRKKTILFICTHNSVRSQLAEGLVNHFFSDKWCGHSAGMEATFVKPFAIQAMKEAGIDVSTQTSKTIEVFKGQIFDVVVTVCESAKETCPFFPGKKVIHKSFIDPSNTIGTDQEKLMAFCRTRDEIHLWLTKNLKNLFED